jgi:hypothetical protein
MQKSNYENDQKISEGLDFILNHFEDPHFPRTVSTRATNGKQKTVNIKDEALARFKQANYFDCRINAFPQYTEHNGKNIQESNFIFIDLDRNQFKNENGLTRTLNFTLKKMKEIDAYPTVLCTGNGFHVYQPIDGGPKVLEQYDEFKQFSDVSKKFLRFAAIWLSNGNSDPNNNPSLKSCLLRIPGSINSKFIQNGIVTILQKWDGIRPSIKLLIGDFYAYLIDLKVQDETKLHGRLRTRYASNFTNGIGKINWIETLLQTPIYDYRKNAIALILAPYLINVKKVPYTESCSILVDWLDKCSALRKLDNNFYYRIKYSLKTAIEKKIPPMNFDTLKNKNTELHRLLMNKIHYPKNNSE